MSAGAESPLASGVGSGSVVCCARLGVGSAIVIVVRRDKIVADCAVVVSCLVATGGVGSFVGA
jgi:hypothetical protein